MRILMISDVYFPRINGVSTSIQTFRRELHAAGHETVLIAPEYPSGGAADEPPIIRVPSRYLPRDPEDRLMKLGALRSLRRQLAREAFDLVHIQTPFIAHYQGIALARALGVPAIETYHTYFEEYLHHYVPLMPRAVMRFVARRFTVSQCNALDALVVPSQAMERALLDYGVRCPMHVIPTGMDMQRFKGGDGARFRADLGIAADRPVLVHVGRIAHEKNIDFLFRASRGAAPGRDHGRCGRRPGARALQVVCSLARHRRAGPLRWLPVARVGAARLLSIRRCVRVLVEDRDAGPGAARSDGARRTGRLDGAHGHCRDRLSTTRRRRRARRRSGVREDRAFAPQLR
jgi:Glycosyltransferase Family 4